MRYLREVRWRFVGPQGQCRLYIPQARTILGELVNRDREIGGLDLSIRRVTLPDGTKITAFAADPLPIVTIEVTPLEPGEEPPRYTIKAVWEPEGIMMTPVTAAEPDGYGLPSRDPDTGDKLTNMLGTLAGDMPQVLINRFPNNKYLDRDEFIRVAGEEGQLGFPFNNRLRDEAGDSFSSPDTQYQYWHPLYNPLDCGDDDDDNGINYWPTDNTDIPGIYLGEALVWPQYPYPHGQSQIIEPESEEWYTHRPEEVLYYYEGYEGCFQETNRVRADAGLDPLFRPLRGHADLAYMGVREVARSGLQYHDNPDFRPGFRFVVSRGGAAQSLAAVAENLQINPYAPGTFDAGVDTALIWEASPVHYANMTQVFWDDASVGTEMFIASVDATVTDTVSLGELTEPVSGTEWGQVFAPSTEWVPIPAHYHEGPYRTTGNFGKVQGHDRGGYLSTSASFFAQVGQVVLAIPQDLLTEDAYAVIGTATFTKVELVDDVEVRSEWIRAVVACGDQYSDTDDYDTFTLAVLISELNSTGKTDLGSFDVTGECRWEVEAEYEFDASGDTGWIGAPPGQVAFSPDGSKFVFTMHKLGTRYSDRYLTRFDTPHTPVGGMSDYVDVEYWRVEFDAFADPVPGFTLTEIDMPIVSVSGSETRDMADALLTSQYRRSTKGSFPAIFDYDEDGELIWATCEVDEYTYCNYPVGGNGTRTRRKLVFPSGKEITYMNENMVENAGSTMFKAFHHINVRTEDVIYLERDLDTKLFVTQENLDNLITDKEWVGHYGSHEVKADLGKFPDNEEVVLYDGGDGVASFIVNSNGNGYPDTSYEFQQPNFLYQSGQFPATYITGSYPALCVSSLPIVNNDAVGAGIDYVNSILLENHRCNFLLGLPNRGFGARTNPINQIYNSAAVVYYGTTAIYDKDVTLRNANVQPAVVPENIVDCKLVRYKDRIVIRLEHLFVPYQNLDIVYNGTHNGLDVVDTITIDWDNVPAEAEVILWSNFDLDSAVGMSDVTDIEPFGRVG